MPGRHSKERPATTLQPNCCLDALQRHDAGIIDDVPEVSRDFFTATWLVRLSQYGIIGGVGISLGICQLGLCETSLIRDLPIFCSFQEVPLAATNPERTSYLVMGKVGKNLESTSIRLR